MKSVKFAIVGTNFISDWFVEAAKSVLSAEIVAIYSRKYDTGKAFAEKHGIKNIYSNYEEMLESNIDAVYIASPTMCHKEHSVKAMNYGKHVLTEKMIAASYSDFLTMKNASLDTGCVLLEAMRPLFDPAYLKIKELMPRLGKIQRVSLEYLQYSSRYDKFKSGVIENAFKPEMKNSALADIGIYPLNTAVNLFGMPENISAASVFLSNGFEGEGKACLDYADFTADVVYSKIRDGLMPSFIEGEYGILKIDKISSPKKVVLSINSKEPEIVDLCSPENNMCFEISAFCDMVGGVQSYLPYLDHTENVMKCVDMIYKSIGIDF